MAWSLTPPLSPPVQPAPPLGETHAVAAPPYVSSGGTMVAQAPAIENTQQNVGSSGLMAMASKGAAQPSAAGAMGPTGGLHLSVRARSLYMYL